MAVLLAALCLSIAGATASLPVVRYDFSRAACLAKQVQDSLSESLLGSLRTNATLLCSSGNGLATSAITGTYDALMSTRNVSQLLHRALDNASSSHIAGEFSFEAWIKQATTGDTGITSMIALEPVEHEPSPSMCANSLTLKQEHDQERLLITLCKQNSYGYPCHQYIDFAQSVMANLTHMVITADRAAVASSTKYSVYIGGVKQVERVFSDSECGGALDASNWFQDHHLKLQKDWHGEMYSFNVYRDALTVAQIADMVAAGVANSLPLATSADVTVQQNGEVGDHSAVPAFYLAPIPADELALVFLLASDVDDDPASSLYNATTGPTVRVQITSLPSHGGLLYQADGTPILSSGAAVLRNANASGNFTVRFRPPTDVCSANSSHFVSSFTFRAIDGVTSVASTHNATVRVAVTSINQPPVASVMARVTLMASTAPTPLPPFNGTDPDDSAVVGAAITALPARGDLYIVHANGTISRTPINVTTAAGSATFLPLGLFQVAYRYTGSHNLAVTNASSGAFAQDSFRFAVRDAQGRLSVSLPCNVTVSNAVRSLPYTQNELALEGQPSPLLVQGEDLSGLNRSLHVRITRFPSRGTLYSADADGSARGRPLNASQATADGVIGHGNASMKLYYCSHQGYPYFTTPNVTWNGTSLSGTDADSFEYALYAEGAPLALSQTVSQSIKVRNVNAATQLSFVLDAAEWPEGIKIHALSMMQSDDSVYPTFAILQGFALADDDRDVDLIRVRVSSLMGSRMSLNPLHVGSLDFNSAGRCLSGSSGRWYCIGSGRSDAVMDFLATPLQAQLALNGMRYESTRPHLQDVINVTVSDGAGGECLDDALLSSESRRQGICFSASLGIDVVVVDFSQADGDNAMDDDMGLRGWSGISVIDNNTQYIVFAVTMLLCVCMCRCCYLRCVGPRKNKHHQSEAGSREGEENMHRELGMESKEPPPVFGSTNSLDYSTSSRSRNSAYDLTVISGAKCPTGVNDNPSKPCAPKGQPPYQGDGEASVGSLSSLSSDSDSDRAGTGSYLHGRMDTPTGNVCGECLASVEVQKADEEGQSQNQILVQVNFDNIPALSSEAVTAAITAATGTSTQKPTCPPRPGHLVQSERQEGPPTDAPPSSSYGQFLDIEEGYQSHEGRNRDRVRIQARQSIRKAREDYRKNMEIRM